jgi:hypothetical protein
MGYRKKIGSLFCFRTNRARNRLAIRTQIRTRVDGPLGGCGVFGGAPEHVRRALVLAHEARLAVVTRVSPLYSRPAMRLRVGPQVGWVLELFAAVCAREWRAVVRGSDVAGERRGPLVPAATEGTRVVRAR